MSFELKQSASGIWSGSFSSFPSDVASHGLSGRLGGVSEAPYDSLNLALHVGDEPEAVIVNRRRYLTALGLDAARLVTPEQVHGEAIARVTARDASRGALSYDDAIAATDALITDEEDLPLLLCFADCTPILFLDPVRRAVGIAHGGWKGTVRRIAAKTVRRMQDEFGSRVEDILVGIGPSIGPCCYEVGAEVAEQFRAAFPGHERELFTEPQPGHYSSEPLGGEYHSTRGSGHSARAYRLCLCLHSLQSRHLLFLPCRRRQDGAHGSRHRAEEAIVNHHISYK